MNSKQWKVTKLSKQKSAFETKPAKIKKTSTNKNRADDEHCFVRGYN